MGDNLAPIDLGSGRTATAVAAGSSATCALLDNGTVKCWGGGGEVAAAPGEFWNFRGDHPGEMGDNLTAKRLGTGRTATAVSASGGVACVLLDDGTVKCWGANGSGQLGQGDTDTRGGLAEMGDNLPTINLGGDAVFSGVEPVRVLDTRDGLGVAPQASTGPAPVAASTSITIHVTSATQVPDTTVAVVVDLTTTRSADAGFLTVHPCSQPIPEASNVNYRPGIDTANLAIAPVSADGNICVYASATTDVIVDVTGYTTTGYQPNTPTRLADTRQTTPQAADTTLRVALPSGGGHVVTVTATRATAAGFLTAYDCAQPRPDTSIVNYVAGVDTANLTIATGDRTVRLHLRRRRHHRRRPRPHRRHHQSVATNIRQSRRRSTRHGQHRQSRRPTPTEAVGRSTSPPPKPPRPASSPSTRAAPQRRPPAPSTTHPDATSPTSPSSPPTPPWPSPPPPPPPHHRPHRHHRLRTPDMTPDNSSGPEFPLHRITTSKAIVTSQTCRVEVRGPLSVFLLVVCTIATEPIGTVSRRHRRRTSWEPPRCGRRACRRLRPHLCAARQWFGQVLGIQQRRSTRSRRYRPSAATAAARSATTSTRSTWAPGARQPRSRQGDYRTSALLDDGTAKCGKQRRRATRSRRHRRVAATVPARWRQPRRNRFRHWTHCAGDRRRRPAHVRTSRQWHRQMLGKQLRRPTRPGGQDAARRQHR